MSDFQARRQSDNQPQDSKVRREIMEQLTQIDNPEYRVVLTMMLRMQDETNVYFSAIQGHMIQLHAELGKLQRTDDQIRAVVLNGHTDRHHTHHSWIDNQMNLDAHCGLIMGKHGDDGLCEHARQLIEDAKVAKVRRWKVVDSVAEKAVWVVLVFIGGLIAAKYFPGGL